jgi:hypothetical protein
MARKAKVEASRKESDNRLILDKTSWFFFNPYENGVYNER